MVEVEVRGNGRRLTFEDRTKQRRHYKKDEEEGRGNDDDDTLQEFQLRWDLSPRARYGHCLGPIVNCCTYLVSINKIINESIIISIEWVFQTTFLNLIGIFIIFFFGWVCFFGLLIWIASDSLPECLSTSKDAAYWQDSFALSWTTFSTVGYGHIYPALASTRDASSGFTSCVWVYTICAVESFVGVLYAGICGALLFAKIYRVQSQAPVVFSKAITVKYGEILTGVDNLPENHPQSVKENATRVDSDEEQFYDAEARDVVYACPVITIMIVNKFANEPRGGELIDVSLSAVVTKKLGDIEARKSSSLVTRRNPKPKSNESSLKTIYTVNGYEEVNFIQPDHYLFNRVWTIDHVLDEKSPLLKSEVRGMIERIKENNPDSPSIWPSHLNSPESIRKSLEPFQNLVVTMKAIANSSAVTVHGHEVYDFKNSFVIGYRHSDVTYFCTRTNCIRVDFTKVDDIIEIGKGMGEDIRKISH